VWCTHAYDEGTLLKYFPGTVLKGEDYVVFRCCETQDLQVEVTPIIKRVERRGVTRFDKICSGLGLIELSGVTWLNDIVTARNIANKGSLVSAYDLILW